MTQEEKHLLLVDLCARLPYKVKCLVSFDDGTKEIMTLKTGLPNSFGRWDFYNENCSGCSNNFKPYLRPMSSMTEEEKKELFEAINKDMNLLESILDKEPIFTYHNSLYRGNPIHYELDFLISHHFDYRGLIPMGLALEAAEDMYKN